MKCVCVCVSLFDVVYTGGTFGQWVKPFERGCETAAATSPPRLFMCRRWMWQSLSEHCIWQTGVRVGECVWCVCMMCVCSKHTGCCNEIKVLHQLVTWHLCLMVVSPGALYPLTGRLSLLHTHTHYLLTCYLHCCLHKDEKPAWS